MTKGIFRPVIDRFMDKVYPDPNTGCWLWGGAVCARGRYGSFCADTHKESKKHVSAHRWAYEYFKGPIPKELEIDHKCRQTMCVNPDHLRAITHRENTLCGLAPSAFHILKTHCPRGHEYTQENTRLYKNRRNCRICEKLNNKRHSLKRSLARVKATLDKTFPEVAP